MKPILPLAAALAVAACASTDDMGADVSASAQTAATASAAAASPSASMSTQASAATTAQAPASPAPTEEMRRAEAEAALRQLVNGLQSGNVDYTRVDDRIAGALRPQAAAMQARMAPRGPIQTIEYLSTEANGEMQFRVRYDNESSRWGISLDNQGRITGLNVYD